MPDSPPRLASADPGTQPGYAPLSWTAVASLAVAIVYAVLLGVMVSIAFRGGKQLIEPWLLLFPAVAIVLAFVARRQIRASEGTRVGEKYANLGWWVAVVGGLAYVAYLGAIEFAIRRDAQREFVKWADELKKLNPSDPKDPAFYNALHMTIDPGLRAAAPTGDPVRMEANFRDAALAFRAVDVVRVCSRNRGAVEIRPEGLRDWQQKPTEITCTLTAVLVTPEGEHRLIVPMRAVIDEKTKQRRWQIAPVPGGYVQGRSLSRYGWTADYLEASGRQFSQEFMAQLSSPGGAQFAYHAFVDPDVQDPQQAVDQYARVVATSVPRAAVAGAISHVPPVKPGAQDHLTQKVLTRPGGGAHDPTDLARFVHIWNSPGRILPAGTVVKSNPDTNPSLAVEPGAVECRVPVEIQIGGSASAMGSAARGAVILRVTAESAPKVFADLDAARQAGASSGLSERPPADLAELRIPWRVVRLESDLRPMPVPRERDGPGGPPGMPGMPGMPAGPPGGF